MESTEPNQVYGVELDFVSERTIKDHHHHKVSGNSTLNAAPQTVSAGLGVMILNTVVEDHPSRVSMN